MTGGRGAQRSPRPERLVTAGERERWRDAYDGRMTNPPRTGTALLLLASIVALRLPAQGDAVARSQQARASFRRAAAAERAGALDSAWADLQRAQAAWPEQPAYSEALARWAARRGELGQLDRALALLAAQGTGEATARDSNVRRIASASAAIATRLAALDESLRPVDGGTSRVISPDTAFWPEGLDADPRDGTLYVTSIRHRNVLVVPPGGPPRWLLGGGSGALPSAVMGVAVDPARDVVWLTTAGHPAMRDWTPADSATSELLRVRDGVIERRWRLAEGSGVPGELAVAPDGEVVVSDAVRGRLLRLRAGRDSLEVVTHPLLRSPQGIAFSADGRLAWIADWSHGLVRWERDRGRLIHVESVTRATLLGIDGLRRDGDRLIAVQNGVAPARVIGIALADDGARATGVSILDRPERLEGEPTIGAIVGDAFVYVSSSQWPFWNEDASRHGAAPLPAVVLRAVPLRR